ncbi:Uncharacterised protein [Mycobacteroides abscessus subsp. bolletii]|nr:Uncharacterised protein [Mycobacteroides abscessus subsp. bolletii]
MRWKSIKGYLTSFAAVAAIGLAPLAPSFDRAVSTDVVAGHEGGNNRDHARLGTGQYSISVPASRTPFSSPPSGAYIG